MKEGSKKEKREEWLNRGVVGDAFGVRYEKLRNEEAVKMLEADGKMGSHRVLGGGPCSLMPGQLTEGGELSMVLARSLVKQRNYDEWHVGAQYTKWLESDPPFEVCDVLKQALSGCARVDKKKAAERMRRNALKSNYLNLNGSFLVRIPALVVASKHWTKEMLLQVVRRDCGLTHSNPIVLDAARCYAVALRTAILTGNRKSVHDAALAAARTRAVRSLLRKARSRPEPVLLDEDSCEGGRKSRKNEGKSKSKSKGKSKKSEGGGYSRVVKADSATHHSYFGIALQSAFYELLNGSDFRTSLVSVVSRGGATTTNCFVAGSLLGALHGFRHLPAEWCSSVVHAFPEKRLAQLKACASHDLLPLADLLLKGASPL